MFVNSPLISSDLRKQLTQFTKMLEDISVHSVVWRNIQRYTVNFIGISEIEEFKLDLSKSMESFKIVHANFKENMRKVVDII